MPYKMIIQCEHISKSFGKLQAVQDISLEIQQGEMFALLGPDGAGKTTLFRLLTTLLTPDQGEAISNRLNNQGEAISNRLQCGTIKVLGLDTVKDYAEIRKHIGYMPGRFSLYGDMTVEENLQFFASLYGVTVEANRHLVDDIYKQIEPFKHRKASQLSGGMKQKLALSCALIHAPKILFLDEPTTGIDPVSRRELWEMLKRLQGLGITIIASTPYLDEALFCDRAAFMQEGRIVAIDTPAVIVERFKQTWDIQRVGISDEKIIDVHGLTKCFGDFTAVDHISFSVRKGEIFGFLGANGAGKTTAMRILAGLSIPTDGEGTIMGYDVRTQTALINKHIGYMSQRFSLYEDLKVWENIRLFAGIYGLTDKQIAERTDELLNGLNAMDLKDRMVKSLPLGWKQKIAFAVAIAHKPEIVFLDEPTGGVDPLTRRSFWDMIAEAAAQGTTIFVTTHYMDEAEYCDRVSIMVDGRIEALDSPANLQQSFGVETMDAVFRALARKAKRGVE